MPTIVHIEPYKAHHKIVEMAAPDCKWVHFTDHQAAADYLTQNHDNVDLVVTHLRKDLEIHSTTEAMTEQAKLLSKPKNKPGGNIVSLAQEWGLPLVVHAGLLDDWHEVKAPGMFFVPKPSSNAKMTLAVKRAMNQPLPQHVAAFVPDPREHEKMDWDIKHHGVIVFSDVDEFKKHLSQNADLVSAIVVDRRNDPEDQGIPAMKAAEKYRRPTIAWISQQKSGAAESKAGATHVFKPTENLFEERQLNELVDKITGK